MKVQEFEELNVYQRARELTNRIYDISRDGAFARDFGLVTQIRRASVSIMSNIAEGFERGTNGEFVQFLYIAKGSSGEVRAQLLIAFDQKYISQADYDELTDRCRRISGMLNNLINVFCAGESYRFRCTLRSIQNVINCPSADQIIFVRIISQTKNNIVENLSARLNGIAAIHICLSKMDAFAAKLLRRLLASTAHRPEIQVQLEIAHDIKALDLL